MLHSGIMNFKKEDISTVVIIVAILFLLCLFFNKLHRGYYFFTNPIKLNKAFVSEEQQEMKKKIASFFVTEEMSVIEEKKIQETVVEEVATSSPKIAIFVYHSVRPHILHESKIQDTYDVTPELFEEHLRYLKENGYTVITMDRLESDLLHGIKKTDTTKRVVISFDDGWENQYTYAYPLLKKYKVPAIFYVYTQPLGYKHFLTWQQIKEMKANGMEIGSHTLTHPFFKKINDEKLRFEISESKKRLEKELGSPVNHFASPFGYSNTYIESVVKESGYHTGRTIFRGVHHKDMYSLRGNLLTDSMKDFIEVLDKK